MKKFLLIIITGFSVLTVCSQNPVTITAGDLPKPGRDNVVAYDTLPQVNIGYPSSVAQAWDFTGLALHYNKYANYSPTAPYQQHAASFPGSDMYTYGPAYMFTGFYGAAPVDASAWGYLYWVSDSSGYRINGFRGDYGLGDRNVLESPQELLMGVPSTLGTSFNNQAQWEILLNGNPSDYDTNYVSKVSKTLVTDAYGQMTTSFGTFNVIRVHEHAVRTDSVYSSLNGVPLPYPGYVIKKDTVNNYYFWAKNVCYPVAIVFCDEANLVKDIEYLTDTIQNYLVSGTVFQDDGLTPITSGKVRLIARSAWDALFGVAETVNIMPGGHFQFASVVGGNWLVQAFPDTTTFPDFMPTYYTNAAYWQNAGVLSVSHDTSVSITCNYAPANISLSDSGNMNGTVYENIQGPAKSGETPAEDISVILIDSQDSTIQRHGKTDHLGQFHFKNLQNGNYKIRIDIPGDVQLSTYDIAVNNSTHSNLDFVYDTTKIITFQSSGIQKNIRAEYLKSDIYPNPAHDNISIYIDDKFNREKIRVDILNIMGKEEISVSVNNHPGVINLDIKNLSPGIYFVNLYQNSTFAGTRKLVIKK